MFQQAFEFKEVRLVQKISQADNGSEKIASATDILFTVHWYVEFRMNACIRYFIPIDVGEEPFIVRTDIPYVCQKTNVLDEFSFCHMLKMMRDFCFYGGLQQGIHL